MVQASQDTQGGAIRWIIISTMGGTPTPSSTDYNVAHLLLEFSFSSSTTQLHLPDKSSKHNG